MKKLSKKLVAMAFATVLTCSICLAGCEIPQGDSSSSKTEPTPAVVTVDTWKMLEGKAEETTVYHFTTDKPGPKIAIVGGIHGDEVAGWTEGLNLVDAIPTLDGVCGEILLIPQANILADNKKVRYNVSSSYSDLNRSFPTSRVDGAKTATIVISNAIIEEITAFIGDSYETSTSKKTDICIIDLHESQHSWTTGSYLGNTLIFNNNALFMQDVIDRYNEVYRQDLEENFSNEAACKDGSFSKHFSALYPKATVFTIETNRERTNGADTVPLATRVRHQNNILNSLFDYVWNRI